MAKLRRPGGGECDFTLVTSGFTTKLPALSQALFPRWGQQRSKGRTLTLVFGAPRTSSGPGGGASAPKRRLAWLDALRGLAALAVVFDHLMFGMLGPVKSYVTPWFAPGLYGVFVFFLISGYIVPASLERKDSVRAFWVSRVFRLYPIYVVAIVGLVLLTWAGVGSLGGAGQHPENSALGQLLMMPAVLHVPDVPYTAWTLSYEMVFYLVLTGLFVTRAHRRSGVSAGFALALAALAFAVGPLLPEAALSHSLLGTRRVALLADALIVGGIALAMTRPRPAKVAGASVAALTALALAFGNGTRNPGEGLTILALMFTGTLIYRAEHGQIGKWKAFAAVLAVFALTVASGIRRSLLWHHSGPAAAAFQHRWASALVLAGLTFAVGMALRHKRVPSFLAWLGLISYSVYLLHPLFLGVFQRLPGDIPGHVYAAHTVGALAFVAVVLVFSGLSYRYIEAPAQRLGARLGRRLDGGGGRRPPARPEPAPSRPVPAADEQAPVRSWASSTASRGGLSE